MNDLWDTSDEDEDELTPLEIDASDFSFLDQSEEEYEAWYRNEFETSESFRNTEYISRVYQIAEERNIPFRYARAYDRLLERGAIEPPRHVSVPESFVSRALAQFRRTKAYYLTHGIPRQLFRDPEINIDPQLSSMSDLETQLRTVEADYQPIVDYENQIREIDTSLQSNTGAEIVSGDGACETPRHVPVSPSFVSRPLAEFRADKALAKGMPQTEINEVAQLPSTSALESPLRTAEADFQAGMFSPTGTLQPYVSMDAFGDAMESYRQSILYKIIKGEYIPYSQPAALFLRSRPWSDLKAYYSLYDRFWSSILNEGTPTFTELPAIDRDIPPNVMSLISPPAVRTRTRAPESDSEMLLSTASAVTPTRKPRSTIALAPLPHEGTRTLWPLVLGPGQSIDEGLDITARALYPKTVFPGRPIPKKTGRKFAAEETTAQPTISITPPRTKRLQAAAWEPDSPQPTISITPSRTQRLQAAAWEPDLPQPTTAMTPLRRKTLHTRDRASLESNSLQPLPPTNVSAEKQWKGPRIIKKQKFPSPPTLSSRPDTSTRIDRITSKQVMPSTSRKSLSTPRRPTTVIPSRGLPRERLTLPVSRAPMQRTLPATTRRISDRPLSAPRSETPSARIDRITPKQTMPSTSRKSLQIPGRLSSSIASRSLPKETLKLSVTLPATSSRIPAPPLSRSRSKPPPARMDRFIPSQIPVRVTPSTSRTLIPTPGRPTVITASKGPPRGSEETTLMTPRDPVQHTIPGTPSRISTPSIPAPRPKTPPAHIDRLISSIMPTHIMPSRRIIAPLIPAPRPKTPPAHIDRIVPTVMPMHVMPSRRIFSPPISEPRPKTPPAHIDRIMPIQAIPSTSRSVIASRGSTTETSSLTAFRDPLGHTSPATTSRIPAPPISAPRSKTLPASIDRIPSRIPKRVMPSTSRKSLPIPGRLTDGMVSRGLPRETFTLSATRDPLRRTFPSTTRRISSRSMSAARSETPRARIDRVTPKQKMPSTSRKSLPILGRPSTSVLTRGLPRETLSVTSTPIRRTLPVTTRGLPRETLSASRDPMRRTPPATTGRISAPSMSAARSETLPARIDRVTPKQKMPSTSRKSLPIPRRPSRGLPTETLSATSTPIQRTLPVTIRRIPTQPQTAAASRTIPFRSTLSPVMEVSPERIQYPGNLDNWPDISYDEQLGLITDETDLDTILDEEGIVLLDLSSEIRAHEKRLEEQRFWDEMDAYMIAEEGPDWYTPPPPVVVQRTNLPPRSRSVDRYRYIPPSVEELLAPPPTLAVLRPRYTDEANEAFIREMDEYYAEEERRSQPSTSTRFPS